MTSTFKYNNLFMSKYVNKVLSTPYNLGHDHFGMDAPFKMIDFVLVRFLVPD